MHWAGREGAVLLRRIAQPRSEHDRKLISETAKRVLERTGEYAGQMDGQREREQIFT